MKVKLRLRTRFSLEECLLFIALFCVSTFALLEHVSISIPLFSYVKKPVLLLGGLCLGSQAKMYARTFMKKKYFFVYLSMFAFCGMLLISALNNQYPRIGKPAMDSTLRLVVYLLELILLMVWIAETGRGQFVLAFLFRYVLIMTLATDLLLFSGLITFGSGRYEYYLVGTKFIVAYFHINLLALWFINKKEQFYTDRKAKRIVIFGVPIVAAVSYHVDCMTGILGCCILLLLFIFLNTPIQKKLLHFCSPKFLCVCLALSVIFPFVVEGIVEIPFIKYLIEEILGRNTTLTGRVDIFNAFIPIMEGYWLWGYGYGNGNVVSMALFGCANAQNAQLHWVLQSGILATVMLVILMYVIFRQLEKSAAVSQCMPLVLLVYMYIFLGTIEITFSMSFLLWVAVIFMLTNEKKSTVYHKEGGAT